MIGQRCPAICEMHKKFFSERQKSVSGCNTDPCKCVLNLRYNCKAQKIIGAVETKNSVMNKKFRNCSITMSLPLRRRNFIDT